MFMEPGLDSNPMRMTLPLDSRAHEGWVPIPFPVPAVITLTTLGDMSPGTAARRDFVQGITRGKKLCFVRQEHTRVVVDVDEVRRGSVKEGTASASELDMGTADGMVTLDGDVVLGVTVADCVPILIYDRGTGAFGLLHSGWRGTGILEEAVSMMRTKYGTLPEDLVVTLGPAISGASYVVDYDRARRFADRYGESCVVEQNRAWHLDLHAANTSIAAMLGAGCVNAVAHCTASTPLLGSYRRQGPEGFTRMLVLVGHFDT